MRTRAELREAVDPLFVALRGLVRRMGITSGSGPIWKFIGVRMWDGTDETRDVEPFTGIGFYSQPPASGKPEAIVVMVGDANSPACVATRDEATRSASAGDLAADETAIFNSLVRAHCKADGTIELKTILGIAQKMLLGETYRAAEDTLFTGLNTFVAAQGVYNAAVAAAVPALAVGGVASPISVVTAALGVFEGLIAAFQLAAATYLARVGKVE